METTVPSETALLFDLDWTLLDNKFYPSIYEYILSKSGAKNVSIDKLRSAFYDTFRSYLRNGRYVEAFDWDKVMGETLEKLNIDRKVTFMDAFKNNYKTGNAKLIKGVKEFLQYAKEKGFIIGIITNGLTRYQEVSLEETGLRELVHFVVTSDEAGTIKPFEPPFKIGVERAKRWGARVFMFFGDNLYLDIVGALLFGFQGVFWYNERFTCVEEKTLGDFREEVIKAGEYYGIKLKIDSIFQKKLYVYGDYNCLKQYFEEVYG